MKNIKIKKLLSSKSFSVALSIAIAVVAWFSVALTVSDTISTTIARVPVQMEYNSNSYKSLNLDIIENEEFTVDVQVEGPRTVVGGLDANDFFVYPVVTGVTEPGRYDLKLGISKSDALMDFDIKGISKKTISVRFDSIVTKKFLVEPSVNGVEIADGYTMGTVFANPSEVIVTGPETELGRIAKVIAPVEITDVLSESAFQTVKMLFNDSTGTVLDTSMFTIDNEKVEVTLPVLKKAEIPLTVEYINIPQGFDTHNLKYTLSHPVINVAGPESTIGTLPNLVIGYIDLSTFVIGEEYSFDVELPANYLNLDNIISVTATFDTNNMSTKLVTVNDLRVINTPQNYTVNVETKRIYNVMLVGPENVLENISTDNVVAQINANDITFAKGQQNVPVQIIIPSHSNVFASGAYTALINISVK